MTNDSICLQTSKHWGLENLLLDVSCTCFPSFISITVAPWLLLAVEYWRWMLLPSMEERLGNMVTAPTATSSSWWMGLLLLPQLSDPIHRKWPTWLALLVALRTPLQGHLLQIYKHGSECVCVCTVKQKARPALRSWSGFTVAQPCSLSRLRKEVRGVFLRELLSVLCFPWM